MSDRELPGQEHFRFARALMQARQNILPRHLVEPGPDPGQLNELLSMASAAPDHGQFVPWRFVIVPVAKRELLAEVFAQALIDRALDATPAQVAIAREKAYNAPLLMLAIARWAPQDSDVPRAERLVSLGAALQNVLLGAQAMGFGAGLTSGRALTSACLRELFALADAEEAVCFLAIGTVAKFKRPRVRSDVSTFTSSL